MSRSPWRATATSLLLVAGLLVTGPTGGAPAAAGVDDDPPVRYVDPVFADVVETEDIPYAQARTAAGADRLLVLDLFEPVGDTATDRPVVILMSGGGFTGTNKDSALMTRWARRLARLGYVSAILDYRTDPNAESSVFTLVAAVERAVEDLRAAVRWFRANQATGGRAPDFPLAAEGETVDLRIDPERISAGGYSAGAVTSVSASWREVIRPDERDPASDDFNPIVNVSNEGWPWDLAAAASAAGAGLGGPDAGDPPLVMFHGSTDTRVPYDEGVGQTYGDFQFSGAQSCRKSRAAGMDCIFHTFGGIAHGIFDDGPREALMHAEHARFLSCRVGAAGAFPDLTPWIELAAGWAARAGVAAGLPDGRFAPADDVQRGQVVAMLWRLVGEPDVAAPHPFTDVPRWLEPAMRWAAASGVVAGFDDGTVRPWAAVSRAQAARMLHRVAGEVAVDGLPAHGLGDVPPWVEDAVRWLVAPRPVQLLAGSGIATGYQDDTFRPDTRVSRAQLVRWLHGLALSGTAWDAARQATPVDAACHRLTDPA